ncbi:MAG: RNA pseudouridine synthase [Puniceicoccales bacterium]|jgi:23S rRNA-/tRNA-specific pseudouridylate synthase|nr:RNA pseudouridine synthase [Puniceicoccales bacterium]
MSFGNTEAGEKSPLPLGVGVRLAARHPAGLLAFEKPAGLAAHPNRPADRKRALLDAPYDLERECYRLDGGIPLFLLNRIDSPTSGLVLATGDSKLAEQVKESFRKGEVAKTYFAVVKGLRIQPQSGEWRDRLVRRQQQGVIRAAVGVGGVPAISRYQWKRGISTPAPLSLLCLFPQTGRTHQLRVQCAARAHPIAGDKTYGDFAFNRLLEKSGVADRLFLHAASVSLSFSWQGRRCDFCADSPLPEAFTALFPGL